MQYGEIWVIHVHLDENVYFYANVMDECLHRHFILVLYVLISAYNIKYSI